MAHIYQASRRLLAAQQGGGVVVDDETLDDKIARILTDAMRWSDDDAPAI